MGKGGAKIRNITPFLRRVLPRTRGWTAPFFIQWFRRHTMLVQRPAFQGRCGPTRLSLLDGLLNRDRYWEGCCSSNNGLEGRHSIL